MRSVSVRWPINKTPNCIYNSNGHLWNFYAVVLSDGYACERVPPSLCSISRTARQSSGLSSVSPQPHPAGCIVLYVTCVSAPAVACAQNTWPCNPPPIVREG